MAAKALLKAPLYAVSREWERNMHDDSDWYRLVYDPNTGTIRRILTGTTRFGGLPYEDRSMVPLGATPDSVWQAVEAIELANVEAAIRSADKDRRENPDNASRGDILVLQSEHRSIKAGRKLLPGERVEVADCYAYGRFYSRGLQPARPVQSHRQGSVG